VEHTLLPLFAASSNLTEWQSHDKGPPLGRATMPAAVIIGLIVVAIVAGTAISLRTTARTGMPSKEVLDRAARRSRELEAGDKADPADQADRSD
jgi:hypothetical protein